MAVALFALSVVVGLQLSRVLFPLAFVYSETAGSLEAGLVVMGLFAGAPLAAWPLRRLLAPRGALLAALGGAVAVRLAVQFVRPVPLWLAAAGTGLALAAWALQVHGLRTPSGGAAVALGFALGSALDVALRATTWTWDLAWQRGPWPVGSSLALALATAWLALRAPVPAGGRGGGLRLLAFGPFLALQLVFLGSPAFVASQAGASLPVAVAVLLAGHAAAAALVLHPPAGRGAVAAAAAVVAAGAAARGLHGPAILAAAAVGLPASALLLSRVLAGPRAAGFGRTAAGFAGGALLFVVLAFVYQAAYDLAIPFPNAAVPPAAALLLAVPGLLAPAAPVPLAAGGAGAVRRWAVAAPLALLLVPLGLALARRTEVAPAAGSSFRVVDYNVHQGVDPLGRVDPEAMARVIEAQDPDVVVLQEVPRGWVTNGMMDLAEWMSARLGMPYVFGPAADRQFGNAIFSRLPIVERRAGRLGRYGGTMDRGYVWAAVEVGGTRVQVIGTHLAHRPRDRGTRLRQIAALLEAWGGRAPAVIAGDLNAEPGSPELERLLRRGLRSAQQVAGAEDLPTFPSTGELIDHILATPDLAFSGFARPFSRASDHLPLAVTVSVGPPG